MPVTMPKPMQLTARHRLAALQKGAEQMWIGILLMLISGVALADTGDNILIGKWQSDKEKTLAYIKQVYPDAPPQKLAEISKLLGTVIVTFSAHEVTTDIAGFQMGKGQYSILLVTDSLVVVEDKKDGSTVWYRDGVDSYYLVTPNAYMPREYFKKIE